MCMVLQIMDEFKSLGLVDGAKEATLAYLAATTRKMHRKLSVLLVGPSSQGKSTILKTVESLIPKEDLLSLAFITKAAIMRAEDLRSKVLIFIEHSDDPDLASVLRQLISEGRVEYRLVLRGNPISIQLIGPVVHLEATTDEEGIDFQNRNRSLVLRLQSSPEELRERFEQIKHRRTITSWYEERKKQGIRDWHLTFQKSLNSNLRVVIPYAKEIQFKSQYPHAQRFLENVLTLIEAIAFIEQHNREKKSLPTGESYIEANHKDYAMAYRLIQGVGVDTGEEALPDDAIELIRDLRKHPQFLGLQPFGRWSIIEKLPQWSYKRLRRLLKCLEENDLMERTTGAHNAAHYRLTEFARTAELDEKMPRMRLALPKPSTLKGHKNEQSPSIDTTLPNPAPVGPSERASAIPSEQRTSELILPDSPEL